MLEGRILLNPQRFFANYSVSFTTSKFVLDKKNAIYLSVYCVNVVASLTLTSICGEGLPVG